MRKISYFTKSIFLSFIIPGFFAALATGAGDIADSLVVGMALGEDGLAAMSFVTPLYMIFYTVGMAFTGGAIRYSRLMGEGKAEDALAHFNHVTLTCVLAGLLTAALGLIGMKPMLALMGVRADDAAVYEMVRSYSAISLLAAPLFYLQFTLYAFVQADDGQKTAAMGFILGNIADVALNFILVLGLKKGVNGSVAATVIGRAVSVGVYLTHILGKGTLKLKLSRVRWRETFDSVRVGFASSSRYIFRCALCVIMNTVMQSLGGTDAVAVYSLTLNVSYIAMVASEAANSALQPMTATFLGERNLADVKDTLKLSMAATLILTALISGLMAIFAPQVCAVFGVRSATALQWGVKAVRLFCLGSVIGNGLSVYAADGQSTGRANIALLVNTGRSLALYLASALLCAKLLGADGVWWMFPITEAATLLVTLALRKLTPKLFNMPVDSAKVMTALVDGSPEATASLMAETEAFTERMEANPAQSMRAMLIVEELVGEILAKGYEYTDHLTERMNAKTREALQRRMIQVTLVLTDMGDFEVHIRDNARKFNLLGQKTRQATSIDDLEALDSMPVLIIQKNSKRYFYRQYQGFNTLTVVVK